MTAGEVATKAGLARATVSTTLSKLAKSGEVEKAERGYRLPRHPDDAFLLGRSSADRAPVQPGGRRYRRLVLPLGFRFDVDAVIVGGVAHRADCDELLATCRRMRSRSRAAVSIGPSAARGSARAADRRSRRCSPISSSARSRRSSADRAAHALPVARAADPPQRADQPDVPDSVRELGPPPGLEVGQQVELAGVVGAMTRRRQSGTTQSGSPHPPSDRGIRCAGSTPLRRAADDAGPAGDGSRWLSVAAIDGVRCSGVVRRSGVRARSCARRRSGVRFIVSPRR